MKLNIKPNRIAVYLTALAGLCTALAPVVASLDTESTAGVAIGFLGIVVVVDRWLKGWQQYEIDERDLDRIEEMNTNLVSEAPAATQVPTQASPGADVGDSPSANGAAK